MSKAIDADAGHRRGQRGEVVSGNGSMSGPNYERTDKGDPVTAAAAAWQGWGTALKPAHEPIVVARKPLNGTVIQNVLTHGTGALNVDGCRIGWDGKSRAKDTARRQAPRADIRGGRLIGSDAGGYEGEALSPTGRWPANVVLDPEAAALLDAQTGELTSGAFNGRRSPDGNGRTAYGTYAGTAEGMGYEANAGGASRFFFVAQRRTLDGCESAPNAGPTSSPGEPRLGFVPSDAVTEGSLAGVSPNGLQHRFRARSMGATPSGSSARPASDTPTIPITENGSSPASQRGRRIPNDSPANHAGADELIDTTTTTTSPSRSDGSADPVMSASMPSSTEAGAQASRFRYVAKASSVERSAGLPDGMAASHPTVKPIELMRWLVRLVTPPGGTVLDPFAGSGTTGIAATLEGFDFIGIERESEYAVIARARIAWWATHPDGMLLVERLAAEQAQRDAADAGQLDLFTVPATTANGNGRAGEASAERRYTDRGASNFAATPGRWRAD